MDDGACKFSVFTRTHTPPLFPQRPSSRCSSRRPGTVRVDAFLNGLFGGWTKTADAEPTEPEEVEVVKMRVTVTIARPTGLVLAPLGERVGAAVLELAEGGNADNSGMVEVGDVLVGCGFSAPDEKDLSSERRGHAATFTTVSSKRHLHVHVLYSHLHDWFHRFDLTTVKPTNEVYM